MAGNHTDTQKLTPLDKLKNFLNELFQFESQDLDFGVYKILGYKQNEIKKFIDELLVDKVKEQLDTLTDQEIRETQEELNELKASSTIQNWLKAKETGDTKRIEFYEEDFSDEIKNYKNLQRKLENTRVSEDTENQIYNHLTLFFSRYYDKGDFISKRRFGKKEKYVVPYNGEETHFYWANHDQYYIKSSEHFQHFAFKVPHAYGTLEVEFKLTEAQTPQGNEKQNEDTYFVLSETEPEWDGDKLTIYFEFRPLSDEEKQEVRKNGKQQSLDEIATQALHEKLGQEVKTQKLWEIDDKEQTLLLRKLRHFTRKNSYDFFIHKDLKGFLQRELDFYIKSEMVEVDDLYVTEAEFHFDRVKQNFKKIKVFKEIADTIIEFLAQIENFQKKLWEKKKFVLRTDWVITLDRLVDYIGEEAARPLLDEIIQNEEQVAEWRDLLGKENVPEGSITVDKLKSELYTWRKYPIDTRHFNEAFQERLLNVLSEHIDLEENNDGLIIHSDNYHGNLAISTKYSNKISCIHIDPPYNTATSGFLYKNSYKHSSWLSMMSDRLGNSINLLTEDGSLQVHIDENEYEKLSSLMDEFNLLDAGTVIWDKKNPMNAGRGIATQHEYVVWRSNKPTPIYSMNSNIMMILNKASELINEEGGVNDRVRQKFSNWVNNNNQLTGGEKAYRYIDDEGKVYQSVSLRAPEPRDDPKFYEPLIHPVTKKPCKIPPNGFSRTPETLNKMIENGEILFGKDETNQPRQKAVLTTDKYSQVTSIISDGKKGKDDTKPLGLNFPYCHPVSLYKKLIGSTTHYYKSYVLDYFAGSGTTYHSIAELNREDNNNRKYILIEQGEYVDSIINPRIKKIAYSFDWKDGKPEKSSMNGLGVFFKYQRLEQYEESLENIEFTLPEEAQQQALEFEDYVPKYMLDFETRNSPALVNTETMQNPWAYKLKIWDGYTYDTQQAVDLVETFNYLIGLHVQKQITKVFSGRKYQFIQGYTNDQQNVLVVWRSVQGWQQADYEADRDILQQELPKYDYDQLYLNDQAHLEGYQPIEHVFTNQMLP